MEFQEINDLTKEQLQEFADNHMTKKAILEFLGLPVKTSTRECLNRKIELEEVEDLKKRNIGKASQLRPYDKDWLQDLCQNSFSYAEVLKKAGRKTSGGSHQLLKKKIEEYDIDVSHFKGQGWSKGLTADSDNRLAGIVNKLEKYTEEDIFQKDSSLPRSVVRRYIIRHNWIPYKCCQCGCDGNWQGGVIALQLHHIDGDGTNNLKENLEWRCPNCHALTDNYCAKNIG